MDNMYMFYSSVILMSVIQIQYVSGAGCNIVSVTSPSASTLNVVWTTYSSASVYLLDFKDNNATSTAPVVAVQYPPNTQVLVQGLRPGHVYQVTLKVFQFLTVVCTSVKTALTVPAASQITLSKPISSTTIMFAWSSVFGADSYILFVEELTSAPTKGLVLNQTFTTLSAEMNGLSPATVYNSYVYSSNSAGLGAKSTTKTIMTLVQPPTGVSIESTGKSTARVTWNTVSKVLLYQVTVRTSGQPNNIPVIRNTSATYMDITNLGPCYTYTVGVSSLNAFLLPGEPSNVTLTTASINPVTTISVDYLCSSGLVIVTWDLVFGATLYIATAVDSTGASRNCTSASTSCKISSVKCGETYLVNVTAISNDCESNSIISSSFETVPCAPANPQTYHECSSDVIVFSWQPTNKSFYYVATSVDNTGERTECVTLDNKCYFTNVDCGQSYIYTVYAVNSGCHTDASQPVTVHTSPCLPTNILTTADCSSETLFTTWDTAAGALSYTLEAKGNTGETYNCTSNSSSCEVTGVPCGEFLSVWIVASNEHCSTNMVLGEVAQTVPCSPTNVSVSTKCSQDSAWVNWTTSNGAIFYIAVAQDANGTMYTCNSGGTNCWIKGLRCGQNYTASVLSTNFLCNGTSEEVTFRTAPCSPTSIQAFRDCDANQALIVWQNHQPTGLYTATIEDQSGALLTCTSNTVNKCKITSPPCGKRFNVTVTHSDGSCLFNATPISMDSVPCGPKDVGTRVSCVTGELTVTWNISVATSNYTTIISRGMGLPLQCNSTETQCTTGGLLCGSSYDVTVYSITETCFSLPSTVVTVQTLPCPPTNITAMHRCAPDPTPVSWLASNTAKYYSAVAVSSGGYRSECTTNQTSCSLPGLQCGDVYTIGVSGADDNCVGEPSNTITLVTEPCTPTNVSSQLSCRAGIAQVSWVPSVNAVSYAVSAISNGQILTCTSSSPNCTLSNLVCDQAYDIQVTATDGICVSNYSAPFRQDQVPCVPRNVSASLDCFSYSALVTWVGTSTAVGYNVTMADQDGNTSYCYTNTTSCQVPDIHCGKTYNIIVTPYSKTCTGNPSAVYSFKAGLCAPSHVTVSLVCDVSTVSWSPVIGAEMYIATATAGDGNPHTCSSNYSSSCNFTGLQCGQNYVVTVVTLDRGCWSKPSPAVNLTTALCLPGNLMGQVNNDTDTLTLTWGQSPVPGAIYTIQIEVIGGTLPPSVYTTFNTSYTLMNLLCGQRYAIHVAAQDGNCSRSYSPPLQISTGPCQQNGISAIMDCQTHSATISWQPSAGAVSYIATLTASSGSSASCAINNTTCQLSSLKCGEEYNVTVIALGETFNSTVQMAGSLTTGPCLPTNLSVNYNASKAQVVWSAAKGASSYSVQAVTDQGLTVTCNTTKTCCSLNGLQCSKIYNVTVMVQNLACNNTVISQSYLLMTEPCPPQNIQANIECDQLASTVSWVQSSLAVGYFAYFDDQNGHYTSCVGKKTDSLCVASGLMCGTVYSVWVKALGQQYNSSDSTVIPLMSAPCLPRDVKVDVNCKSDGAGVSWNTTYGTADISLSALVNGSLQSLCKTQQNSCNVTGLSCGQTYNLNVTATNKQCSITAPMNTSLTMRPCPPQHVAADLQCGSHTAVLSWEQRSNVDLYVATAIKVTGGEVKKCNSTSSTCQFSGLDCGEMYDFTVTAHSQGCCSQTSSTVSIQTEPCQPVNVSAQAFCQNNTVQISWYQARGVVNYLITATGNLGYANIYNTTQTLLSASLPCGQDYNVTVQAQGSKCDSIPSTPAFFKMTPCIPRNVTTYVQCKFNIGSVSWEPSDGAKTYVVVATGLDGHTHQCLTNTTSCTWNDLHCGEEYSVVVSASDDSCTSMPSSSSVISMHPCVPQNLVASVNCSMEVVSLSWDASNGATYYMVSANAANKTTRFTTNVTAAIFSDLTCGQNYSLSVTPHSQHCPGSSCATTYIQTWPCPTSGLTAKQDCNSTTVMVTWQASNGSDYYTASMQTDTGISKMCMSNSTTCSIPVLTCGYNFSVSVTASNQQCNTTSTQTTSLMSVPCVPTNVSVVTGCANNTAVVSWSASRGAAEYFVMARSYHSNVSCQTSDLSCRFEDLTCGSEYTVEVVAVGNNCSSIPSQAQMFKSTPCPPQNVSTQVSCLSNDLTISWNANRDAGHFLVSVIALNGGFSKSCNTTNTSCSISNVTCGNTFTAQVTSVRGDCSSQQSQTQSISSAPCQPQGIRGNLDCVTNSVLISWDTTPGVDSYTVTAADGATYRANCTTSSNTTCEVKDLECGVRYNFSVIAKKMQCESQPSDIINLQTAPCSLSNITAFPQCYKSSILVVWELMADAGNIVYTATAEAGDHTYLSCNSTGTSCYLYGAHCDLSYTIIVADSSDQCSGTRSSPYRVSMEPCPPRNVMVTASCSDHSALVSWTPSPVAKTYTVVALSVDGHVYTCNTTSSNCSISKLQCNQQYTVFVTANNGNLSSKASQNATLNAGLCPPDGLSVTWFCNNQTALLSWTPIDNAVDYYGYAQDENGDKLYCHSTNPSCSIKGLNCGTVYNFTVQASDGTCNSSFSEPVQRGAAPCPPDDVAVQLLPMQMEIQVMRFTWTQTSCRDTEYLVVLRGSLLGDSQALFNISSYWTNMTYFEIPLPCSSSYVATVISKNAAGTSYPSVSLNRTTAPCPPSGVVYQGNSSFGTVSWGASVFATTYTVYDNSFTPVARLCSTSGLSCSVSLNIASTNLVITASNSAGESEAENITNVVTQRRRKRDLSEQKPGTGGLLAPVLSVTQKTSTVIFVEWSQVDAASQYIVVIRKQGSSTKPQELTVNEESILLTDLSPNSTYCFSVSARNSETTGPESKPVCTQTRQGVPL